MNKYLKSIASVALALFATTAIAQSNPKVGGAEMSPKKTIVENASKSADHTTLVSAVQAAGLVETLKSEGPFTVFAPTNAAFEALPEGTVATLVKPENRDQLTAVLTYHVVAGKVDSKAILAAIKEGKGKAEMKTVQGGTLTFTTEGGKVYVADGKGKAEVTIADVYQSNGVVHVVNKVLLP
jgi:uncharacterized surface protein with fasciclin (FAS1) repeats